MTRYISNNVRGPAAQAMFNDADEAQIVGKDLIIELDDDVYNCVRLKSRRERITGN